MMASFVWAVLLLAASVANAKDEAAMDNIMAVNSKVAAENAKAGFSAVDEPLTFEGDIGFNAQTALQLQYEHRKATGTDTAYDAANNWGFWYRARVPYVIDNSLRKVQRAVNAINAAIAIFNRVSCIRLVPRNGERDYVWMNLNPRKGCWSWIGRQGGGQELSLNWGCHTIGTTVHEIMHAIGFYHEQSRLDRDRYVEIHWNNIPWNQKYNFRMYRRGQATTYGFDYDKQSIMHYSRYSFPLNRRYPTITSRQNYNEKLGGDVLTSIDIQQINRHYSCRRSYSVGFHPLYMFDECRDLFGEKFCKFLKGAGGCKITSTINVCKKTCTECS